MHTYNYIFSHFSFIVNFILGFFSINITVDSLQETLVWDSLKDYSSLFSYWF